MANPKKRKSKSAVRTNRAHLALEETTLNKCPQCGKAVKPHTACAFCGTYRGRQVTKAKTAASVKAKK
jgi:large subunit ribosomal protein L32